MEKVKAREIFNKVKKYNELARYLYQGHNQLTITFIDNYEEYDFESYKDFSKFIRNRYVNVVAIHLLNDEWKHDGEFFTIIDTYDGYRTEFELYVHK